MKIELLQEVGIHKSGTILEVEDTIVLQLEREGIAKKVLETENKVETENVEVIKKKGNPNWGKK